MILRTISQDSQCQHGKVGCQNRQLVPVRIPQKAENTKNNVLCFAKVNFSVFSNSVSLHFCHLVKLMGRSHSLKIAQQHRKIRSKSLQIFGFFLLLKSCFCARIYRQFDPTNGALKFFFLCVHYCRVCYGNIMKKYMHAKKEACILKRRCCC